MKEDESVNEYFLRTLAIVSKMRIHGGKMDECTVVEKILRSVNARFNYVVFAI